MRDSACAIVIDDQIEETSAKPDQCIMVLLPVEIATITSEAGLGSTGTESENISRPSGNGQNPGLSMAEQIRVKS